MLRPIPPAPNTFRPVPNMISVWERNVYVKFCLFTLLLGICIKTPHNFFFISWKISIQILSQTACQFISQTHARSPIKSSKLKSFRIPWMSKGLIQWTKNILYAGQIQCTNEANHGTADEEIARAKQRACQLRQRRRPSSKVCFGKCKRWGEVH